MKSSSKMAENTSYYAVYYLTKQQHVDNDELVDEQFKQTLNRMLDDLATQNESFTALLTQLQLDEENCDETLSNVFAQMLSDSVINWGRLVTICGFSGCAAKYLLERGASKDVINRVAKTCTDFVNQEFTIWIEKQGGWDKFPSKQEKPEPWTWNGWGDVVRMGIRALSSAVSVR